MDMNVIDIANPQFNVWMLQEMELAMQRLNVSIQEVQRWLAGNDIPSDPNKFALYECFTNYKLLMEQNSNNSMSNNDIQIKAEPMDADKATTTHNHDTSGIDAPPLPLPNLQLTPSPSNTDSMPTIDVNINEINIDDAVDTIINNKRICNEALSVSRSCDTASNSNVDSFLYAFPPKIHENKGKQIQKKSNISYRNRNKMKSDKLRNDTNDKENTLIKMTTAKYKKLKKEQNKNTKKQQTKCISDDILQQLVKPIKSIKSRGGGGIIKPIKDEFYRLISRTDVEGKLEFMDWNGTSLAHCFVTRTDKIIKMEPDTGKEVHDVIVSEGHKCKTANCKYPHLYSQKCHWKRHALTEHCHRKFLCQLCGAIFRQQTQRKEHIINKHTESMTKWMCPYGCGGVFSQFRGVVRHVKLNRKCDARNTHFSESMIDKLKTNWDNDAMKNVLQFTTNTNIQEENMVSKEMKIAMRKKTRELLKE